MMMHTNREGVKRKAATKNVQGLRKHQTGINDQAKALKKEEGTERKRDKKKKRLIRLHFHRKLGKCA